jgi:hypothetical protein
MRTRTCYERFESAAFRTVIQLALLVAAATILVKLAKWVA